MELEDALREQCPSVAEQVIAAIEPCFVLDVVPDADPPVGVSKLGGAPDLPAGVEWPASKRGPLDFVAQIELATLPGCGLPERGLLSFFADVWGSSGLYPEDRDGFRVIWSDGPVERRDGEQFACGRVTPREQRSIPLLGAVGLGLGEIDVPDDEADALEEIRLQFGPYDNHQLLGHADYIQHPIEEEVVQAINGCFSTRPFDMATWKRVEHQTADWRLLLQVASYSELDYMWGDVGKLFFAIRRDALARPDSEHAWFNFQCH